jgi:putative FmdB family regulatory protein
MPIYEYTCQDCGHGFEKFVRSVTSVEAPLCPQCGGTHVKKGWSVFGMGKTNAGSGGFSSTADSSCSPAGT